MRLAPRLLLLLTLLLALCQAAAAQTETPTPTPTPGSLDTSYGVNGIVAAPIAPSNWAVGVALQADGKSVVAVHGTNPSGSGSDFYAARYDATGTLDPTFGSGGVVRLQFTAAADAEHITAVAIQPSDGKILLAGYAYIKSSNYGFAVARLNTDGSLDASFGTGGKAFFSVASSSILKGLALQSDGKVLLAGNSISGGGSGSDFLVARLTIAGKLDPTFGSGGKVSHPTSKSGSDGGCNAIALQSVGGQERIVVGGARPGSGQTPRDFALMRLTPSGALDSTFGTGGKVFTDFGGTLDSANSLVVVGDRIIAAGRAMPNVLNSPDWRFALARYQLNGQLDPTFGTGGKVKTSLPGAAVLGGLAVQGDGKIVAGGRLLYTPSGTPSDFALVRYNADGSTDSTFGPDASGQVVTDFSWSDGGHNALALQADGKILAAGGSYPATPGPQYYVTLMRYAP